MAGIAVVVVTCILSAIFTVGVRFFARRFHIVDKPGLERKIHTKATPLLGGVAVIVAFIVGISMAWPQLIGGYMLPKHLFGVITAGIVLLIGGALDDKYNLSPKAQIIFPVLAVGIVVASGIGVHYISNPLGGEFELDQFQMTLFHFHGLPYGITLLADLFSVVWLLGTMYTTKFLDGLDGLVSGITIIGSLIIFVLSISDTVNQPETALLALIVAASFVGFLLFNWNPASIFLGESGSLFAGFILGVLAIISGGKIATALLILGIPMLDVLWVIIRRFFIEKRSPFEADRKHLHLRLVDSGLSHKQTVLLLYVCTIVFGACALLLQSREKVYAFIAVGLVMLCIGATVVTMHNKRNEKKI